MGLGRRFGLVWSSSAASNLADGVFTVALPLYAVALTDSPALVAGLATAASLPWLLVSLPAGALADRIDRRRAMVAVNLVRVALIGGLATAAGTDTGTIVALYLVAFALGTAETLFDTSAQALLPAVVAPADLAAANGRLYATEILAGAFIGPPLGGLLVGVAAVGLPLALGVSGGVYLVAALGMLALRGVFRPPPRDNTLARDIAEGVRFVRHHPALRPLALATAITGFGGMAFAAVFVLYAVGPMGLDEAQYGVLVAAGGLGGLGGAWAASRLLDALGPRRLLPLTILVTLAPPLTAATTRHAGVVGGALVVSSAGVLAWNVTIVSLRQRLTPDALLGRVTAAYRLVGRGGRPLGALAGGFVAEAAGLRAAFVASAVVQSMAVGYLWMARSALKDASVDDLDGRSSGATSP